MAVVGIAGAAFPESDLLETARVHLQKGRYEEALEAYERVEATKSGSSRIAIGKSRAFEVLGRLSTAVELLEQAVGKNPRSPSLLARFAEVRFQQGRYNEAEKLAQRALKFDGRHPLARMVLADVHTETGRLKQAEAGYRWFVRFYNQAQPNEAETLLLVARGAVQYARWKGASQHFNFAVNTLCPDALQSDKYCWQSYHVSGSLLLKKYNRAQAIPEFKQALAINPQATPVLVSLGQAVLQQHNLGEAERYADRALQVNPSFVPALQLKADVRIAQGTISEALNLLAQALAVNPHDQRTLARQAACFLLIDGVPSEFDELILNLDAVEDVPVAKSSRFSKLLVALARRNPRAGYFLTLLGERLESRRQYDLAERLYKQAISLMPQLAEPKTALGMLYMRIGKTDEAQKILDRAFQADPFHVRVSNLRKVLKLLNGYETIATEHFVIRVDSKLDKLLGRYMAEFLEENYDQLVERFGFEPPHRTHFEIYNKAQGLSAHQWFSSRMVGMPWIQTIGASTGVIVALASPTAAAEPFNWARVLKHEFVHIITLQQTNFNIPHWFTEALAVSAEGYPRPAVWDRLLLKRVPQGDLRSLDELNDGFVRPRSPLDWQFTYCQSRLYAQYMVEQYGPQTIPKLLAAYRDNQSTDKAIPHVFGVDKQTFEKGYREFLDRIVAEFGDGQKPQTSKSPAEIEKNYRNNPDDPQAAAEYADLLLGLGKRRQVRKIASKALQKNKQEPLAAVVMARLELRSEDVKAALAYLEEALDRDKPHHRLLRLLASLKLLDEKYPEAADLYELGSKTFPHDVEWLKGMAAVYLKLGETAKFKAALVVLSQRIPDDPSVRKKLAELALSEKDYAAAVQYGRMTLHIDVLDADVHRLLGEAYHGLKKYAHSVREFEVALQLKPGDLDLQFGLARSQLAAGDKKSARAGLEGILKQKPDYQPAKIMLEGLD